jgi:hypothetical protein
MMTEINYLASLLGREEEALALALAAAAAAAAVASGPRDQENDISQVQA